jgi:hypothetical protein
MEIKEKFLPIGTVVMLKDGTKRVMISGFCSSAAEDTETIWDYTGCPYPEGYISSNQTCLFNHDQIVEVYSMGLEDDEEEKAFKGKLNELIKMMNETAAEQPASPDMPAQTGTATNQAISPETPGATPMPLPNANPANQ